MTEFYHFLLLLLAGAIGAITKKWSAEFNDLDWTESVQ